MLPFVPVGVVGFVVVPVTLTVKPAQGLLGGGGSPPPLQARKAKRNTRADNCISLLKDCVLIFDYFKKLKYQERGLIFLFRKWFEAST